MYVVIEPVNFGIEMNNVMASFHLSQIAHKYEANMKST